MIEMVDLIKSDEIFTLLIALIWSRIYLRNCEQLSGCFSLKWILHSMRILIELIIVYQTDLVLQALRAHCVLQVSRIRGSSHYNGVTMSAMASQSPASWLLTQSFVLAQMNENIKTPRHWPLCGEFTGDRWIFRSKGQWRGKCFHFITSSWSRIPLMSFLNWFVKYWEGVLLAFVLQSHF